jgi:hypothetical protein
MKILTSKIIGKFIFVIILLSILIAAVVDTFAQGNRPPRVDGETTVGSVNGQPITGNDLILMINNDSPFMPPLDGSPVPLLERYENNYPADPSPTPTPATTPKPPAPDFNIQIQNMMKTGQEWLFKSILDVIIKPLMPILVFFAWIIASFVLIIGFIRRFSDNKGIDPEGLTRWGIRTVIFMVVIGASPFIIDAFTVTGKFIARPIKGYNRTIVRDFDEKMKQYVKNTFSVEDPNALLAERLPNGEPGLVGIIFDKESSVKDITSEMNILGWDMPRIFTFMVLSQNILKFGGLFLSVAGLFILIGLKLAAPILSAFGFDEKFAGQIFYPFCWGVATFALAFPVVKEVTLYVAYGIGLIGLSIYNGETVFTLDANTAQVITSGAYDPASSALIVTSLFFVASLCFILVPWLSYRILRGQVYEGVSQISMGWMLSSIGTALETYGLVAGSAINRQAENTQIHGIYSSERTNAKAAYDAGRLQTDARRVQALAGVQGGLQTTLGQIYGNQTTNLMITNANRLMQLQQTGAATQREIGSQRIDFTDRANRLGFDANREKGNRWVENQAQINDNILNSVPGSQVLGTRGTAGSLAQGIGSTTGIPLDPSQVRETWGNQITDEQYRLNLGQSTRTVASQRENSEKYQTSMETSINQNADRAVSAINKGAGLSAGAARQGAATQSAGIRQSYNLEMQANEKIFTGRNEAALISKNSAEEAAHMRMMSTVVTGFFRDMDRRLEEMKPKY